MEGHRQCQSHDADPLKHACDVSKSHRTSEGELMQARGDPGLQTPRLMQQCFISYERISP